MARVTLRRILQQKGGLTEPSTVALGVELCRQVLSERPLPRRLKGVDAQSLFFDSNLVLAASHQGGALGGMTPEGARGVPEDERSDVFTIGALLHESLLGHSPWPAESQLDFLQAVLRGALEPLRHVPSDSLALLLAKCLRVMPELRFTTITELMTALDSLPASIFQLHERVRSALPASFEEKGTIVPDSEEELMLARIHSGDAAATEVYGDWLETHGRANEAQWVRLDAREPKDLAAMQALDVSPTFIANAARSKLAHCGVVFGFVCPRTWPSLQRTADPRTRLCSACGESVHFASTNEEGERLAMQDRCVAFAPGVSNPDHASGAVTGQVRARGLSIRRPR